MTLIRSQGLARQSDSSDNSVSLHDHAAARVSVVRLTLTNFRCYQAQRLNMDGRPVVLTGPNGAGKTNILEALSFLVPGRGLRGTRLGEASRGEGHGDAPHPWAVAARLETPTGQVDLGTGLASPSQDRGNGGREKRAVHIDGMPARSQSALAEYLSVQWLTPQMDRIFIEGPSSRRRFLDRLVFATDPAHAGRVASYEQAMRERMRLLKNGQPGTGRSADPEWLAALEDTMASRGVAVAAARIDMAARLDDVSTRSHATGAFPGAAIEVKGKLEEWLTEGPALEAEDRLKAELIRARELDAAAGSTSVGAHRSDLSVRHLGTGQDAALCSTGEQKALLIAIVLANARLQASARGSLPLLLLDEVAAHLDSERRQALFDAILNLGVQAWVTGTDEALFEPLADNAQYFGVRDAVVTPRQANSDTPSKAIS